MKQVKSYHAALFFISLSLLSLEISLMRILKVEGFGTFSYTAIALALLGFGASGTFVHLFEKQLSGRERIASLYVLPLFILTLGAGFFLSGRVSFDPLRILWDRNQLLRLLFRFFLYTVPFTFGAVFVLCAFRLEPAGKAYFYNLTGSGAGVFTLLAALYAVPPERVLLVPLGAALLSFILAIIAVRPKPAAILLGTLMTCGGFALFFSGGISVLPYKGLRLALNLPDARIIARDMSPFGTLEAVRSGKIRIAPGLSLAFQGNLPGQLAVFLDGDRLSAVDLLSGDEIPGYLAYQTQSAVYTLLEGPEVLIIEPAGGTPIERALLMGASKVTAVEQNSEIFPFLRDALGAYTGNLFERSGVRIAHANPRSFLKRAEKRWDVIELSVIEGGATAIGGIYSSGTNYTLTVDAFADYLSRLTEGGTLSVTVPLKHPPRNILKCAAIAKEALSRLGLDPLSRLIILRSWSSGTLLIKKALFQPLDIETIRAFCESRFFDFVYYPGITPDMTNRFNVVKDDAYSRYTMQILEGSRYFSKHYIFNLAPPTDERPYFFYFFKVREVPYLLKEMGREWLLFVESGYIVLFATFIAICVLSALLIGLPAFFARKRTAARKAKTFAYFSFIAVAYMFVEIHLMERFTEYLPNPVYSGSAILAALLVFSGAGSFCSDLFPCSKRLRAAFAPLLLLLYIPVLIFLLDRLYYGAILKAPLFLQMLTSVMLIAPLAFAMGLPFPAALSVVHMSAIPRAWSVNGYFSVIASAGAVLLSSNAGLSSLALIALVLYGAAYFVFPE